jgi:Cys-tRNA(Pro)/Cys-tRNA(Cys) deacylase
MTKTNAMRILESAGVAYTVRVYEVSDDITDGVSVSQKLGIQPERVFKTLVTSGKNTGVNVFVIPVEFELDLKKAAQAAGDKYIEMIKSKDLEPLTGYVHGGCSPVGMKKSYPTFIEETAQLHDTLVISAGRVGVHMELEADKLVRATGAVFSDLV